MKNSAKSLVLILLGFFLVITGFAQKNEKFSKTPDGLQYKLFKVSKEGKSPVTGDWISMNMSYATKVNGKDTLLFDNNIQLQGGPVRFQLPPSDFKGDLYQGIQMLVPGDSAIFLINSDSLFLQTFKMKQRPAMIDSNSIVVFRVHLLSVDSPDDLQKNEVIALRKYIADNRITVPPTSTGVYILVAAPGEGPKVDSGSMVNLHFVVSNIEGKQIFSSYDRQEPLQFRFGQKFDTPGIEEAIFTMKKGTKAKVIVPSNMAFGPEGRGTVVLPYSTLIYDVEIVSIQSKEDYEKEQEAVKQQEVMKNEEAKKNEFFLREKYLKDKNITTQPNASGLIYLEKSAGTGPQATAGKRVKVHYTGTLLDGTKFDSSVDRNEPFEFTLGKGMVIKGWDEGIALMKQGGKATLIIPSSIAYGERDMGDIPPFSTLVFEVELVEVN